MTPERWQQVKHIFERAVECGPTTRAEYIRERCGDDEELRKEVEAYINAYKAREQPQVAYLNAPPD